MNYSVSCFSVHGLSSGPSQVKWAGHTRWESPTPATAPLTKLPGKGHSTRQVGFLLLMKWSDFVETVVRLYNEALYPLDDNRRHYFLSVSGMIYRVFI